MQTAYFKDLGLIEYKEAWLFQEKLFNKILDPEYGWVENGT